MKEHIEKDRATAVPGSAIASDKWRNIFHALLNTLVENWKSGIAGKVFLVGSALILLWLVVPLFCSDADGSSGGTSRGDSTPTAVLKHYYHAYLNGDLNEYMGCLDRVHERDLDAASEVAENFRRDDWRDRMSALYGTVSYGVPTWSEDGKMNLKVELENREQGGSSTKEWYLININGAWFIDTQRTTNPFEMGL